MSFKEIRYSHLVNAVENVKLETRYDVVCYYVGRYGLVSEIDLDLINKLYADGFIKE